MKANLYFLLLIFLFFILFLINFKKEPPNNNEFLIISHSQKIKNYYKVKAVNLKNKENYFLYLNEKANLGEKLTLDNFEIKENKIYFPKISKKEKAFPLFSFSSKVRNFYDEKIKKNLPWPEENILRGIIFGENIENPHLYKNFQKAGISHILVASGSNLVLIFSIFLSFLKNLRLNYKISLIISILILAFYLFLVGFEGSILRAFIFILFLIFIKSFSGRIPLKRNIVLTSLIIILLTFPKEIFEIGTILSFLSFVGIIYISPYIKEKLSFLKIDYLKEVFSQSLASFILVFPFLGFVFNSFNPFGLFFNLPILFLLPIVFILGIFVSPFSYLSLILYPPLLFIKKIVELGNLLPEINIFLPSYFYLTFYSIILLLIYKINKNENAEFNFNLR